MTPYAEPKLVSPSAEARSAENSRRLTAYIRLQFAIAIGRAMSSL